AISSQSLHQARIAMLFCLPVLELLPGFREFAGQYLKMYRGDRLFRPLSGELSPDRVCQAPITPVPTAFCGIKLASGANEMATAERVINRLNELAQF
ncbi:hypothetical protein AB0169_27375, partial [Klebsiella pneumoniae]